MFDMEISVELLLRTKMWDKFSNSPYKYTSLQTLETCTRKQGRNFSNNWRGVYSYIRVMPDGFLLKSTQIQKKSVS